VTLGGWPADELRDPAAPFQVDGRTVVSREFDLVSYGPSFDTYSSFTIGDAGASALWGVLGHGSSTQLLGGDRGATGGRSAGPRFRWTTGWDDKRFD
jgi:hypothetical protein